MAILTVNAVRTFAGRPESVRAARIWAASHLPDSPAADDVALMVSELTTNAILHSSSGLPGGSVTVNLQIIGRRIRVEVIDQGAVPEAAEPARQFDAALGKTPGLGLLIVHQLADTFGADGPRRWFAVSLGGAR